MDDSKPLVSILTNTYNRSTLIGRCIESVRSQSYVNYEHIIVDGASDDDTENVVRSYDDPRIKYVKLDTRGPEVQMRAGAALAKGKYITFLDDDDEYLPDKIKQQVELFETLSQDYGMVYCWMTYYDSADPQRPLSVHAPEYRGDVSAIAVAGSNVCGTPTLMIRRDVFEMVGGSYDDSIGYIGSDWELSARVCQVCMVECLPVSLVKVYVNHEHPRLSDDFYADKARRGILFHTHFLKHFKSIFDRYPDLAAEHYYQLLRSHAMLKQRNKAFSYLKKLFSIRCNTSMRIKSIVSIILGK